MIKDSKQYAIELDGVIYSFSGNRLEPVVDLEDIKEDIWFVTDMQEAVSQTMTVEARVKYAEFIVRKRLQESGDFDEPVTVLTHWKKKKGKNNTDIFFTALPTRLHHSYLDQIREKEDSILLFPLYSVLWGFLKRIKKKKPTAVIFQHNRFADIIIGTTKQVYYANRFVTFDMEDEQISSLWETIRANIATFESDNRIKVSQVFLLTWIDSGMAPKWPEDSDSEFYSFEEEAVVFNGKKHNISFLKAMDIKSRTGDVSPPKEKTFYYARKSAPYFNVIFLLVALLLAAGSFWCHKKANMLQAEIKQLEEKMDGIQVKLPLDNAGESYKDILMFIKQLAYCKNAPSYKTVVNDISNAVFSDVNLEVLKINYTSDDVQIEIFGRINTPFDVAYPGYQHFLNILRQRGYTVGESRFDTQIMASQFLVKLVKKVKVIG
jgi:hypothetical protein